MAKGIIYKAVNMINGKVYIGLTTQEFETRKSQHKYNAFNKKQPDYNSYFKRAIRKHGWSNFEWETIDSAKTLETLNEKEIHWIKVYDSFNNGYNLTRGGGGSTGFSHSKEAKEKMSEARRGEKNPMHGKNNPMHGRSHSEEAREKIRKSLEKRYGSKKSKGILNEVQEKHHKAKAVVQLTQDGEFIAVHLTTKGAANSCGSNNGSNITKVCKNKKNSAFGYKWMYAEDYFNIP